MKIISQSQAETKRIAKMFVKDMLKKEKRRSAVVLCLEGDLGVGKTTFTQGFAKGLGVRGKILSPTFVILKKFQIPKTKPYTLLVHHSFNEGGSGGGNPTPYKYFFHIDCYRLKSEKDLIALGIKEIIKNPENILLIEWPERIRKILPKEAMKIQFEHSKTAKERIITIAIK